jgi:DNA-binding LacI/PurR family transcriptional regulator
MIAEQAGVSETFVSYVINAKRKGSRVKKIIEEMIRAKSGEPITA